MFALLNLDIARRRFGDYVLESQLLLNCQMSILDPSIAFNFIKHISPGCILNRSKKRPKNSEATIH